MGATGSMPMYRPYFEELVARAKADGKLSLTRTRSACMTSLDGVRYTNVRQDRYRYHP